MKSFLGFFSGTDANKKKSEKDLKKFSNNLSDKKNTQEQIFHEYKKIKELRISKHICNNEKKYDDDNKNETNNFSKKN